jgi:hypothetical protein
VPKNAEFFLFLNPWEAQSAAYFSPPDALQNFQHPKSEGAEGGDCDFLAVLPPGTPYPALRFKRDFHII